MDSTQNIEKKWQKYWKEHHTFEAKIDPSKEKYYYLVEFPYPSGAGLHVGHVRSYTALDAMARKKRLMGYNVLFPMGWDAFGAPAEQYAIKNHIHPSIAVKENIQTFKGQIEKLGISFDWSREFSTTDPEYYKWTQWQFLQFFKHGMAYKAKKNINWCPKCKTGLSNEDSSGGVCERCGTQVEQREKEQWMLRMSDYSESLIDGLKDTDFQEKIKTAQINWIGKSVGAEVDFDLAQVDEKLKVYTTRPDTLYGVTFMVIAPEHPYIDLYSGLIKNMNEIIDYRERSNKKTEFERTQLVKDKTGVKIEGLTAINPITKKEIPIYISDYVMMNYGTGAIMAVPAHDDRDYDFAKKFGIEVIPVLAPIYESVETPPIEGKKNTERDTVIVVVKHPSEDKYLCVRYQKFGWQTFIMGGIEKTESPEEAAFREVIEESGYIDIKNVQLLSYVFQEHFYAAHKDVNRLTTNRVLVVELNSLNQEEMSEEEKQVQEPVWVSKKELRSFLTFETHRKICDLLDGGEQAFITDGTHINSDILNGLNKQEAIDVMIQYLEEHGLGQKKTNYKLQDWIFTRQRFWGEPIPLIYCEDCGWIPVPEEELPVLLPDVAEYEPTDDGESPLARIPEFVNTTCPHCGKKAKRETDTMPNWAGSSWYWLRYMDPHNSKEFVGQEALKYWGKVDWYNGGMEHTTLHLIYARFWNQFLFNQGLVPNSEPFKVRAAHGMILGEGGVKMSKSLGNVINPDDIVATYGADSLRTYEMFIGDYEKEATWSEQGLIGCRRYLDKVIRLGEKVTSGDYYSKELEKDIHRTVKKVTEDMDSLKFNTAISSLMILINKMEKQDSITSLDYRTYLTLLNPIAPHLTEELNEIYHLGSPICESSWPIYDPSMLVDSEKEIAVQVNGKVRATILVHMDDSDERIEEMALASPNVQKHMEGKDLVKVIVIKGKIVNIVVK